MKNEKFDIYATITDRIIAEMESGVIPWARPWVGHDGMNMAVSYKTGKPYSQLNQLLLGARPGEYLTFNQVKEAGGNVKKGAKASIVVFWKMVEKGDKDEDGNIKVRAIPYLRYYSVFHIDDTEGVKPHKRDEYMPTEWNPEEEAERVISDYVKRSGITLEMLEQNRAYYSPMEDKVVLPLRKQFNGSTEFYSTAFHEFTHSTGHKSRLNRFADGEAPAAFGDENYSKEELVAEIGSCSIMNRLGLETGNSFRNSAAYLQSWIKALRNDKRMIVSAASKAEKAMRLILGETETETA